MKFMTAVLLFVVSSFAHAEELLPPAEWLGPIDPWDKTPPRRSVLRSPQAWNDPLAYNSSGDIQWWIASTGTDIPPPAGPTTLVAVCDTGTMDNHEDLAGQIIDGWNVVDETSDHSPIHYHGTAIAGNVAAIGDNGLGSVGAAPTAQLLSIRISNTTDGWATISSMVECVNEAVAYGAKVVSISYEGWTSASLQNAGMNAWNNGAIVVVSAGNASSDRSAYGDPEGIVVVGAVGASLTKTSWSNYGTGIDFVAPGVGMTSPSTSGGYRSCSGTSCSAPWAAGIIARKITALSQAIGRTPTPAETMSAVSADVIPLGDSNLYGEGLIYAGTSGIQLPDPPPDPDPDPEPEPDPNPCLSTNKHGKCTGKDPGKGGGKGKNK